MRKTTLKNLTKPNSSLLYQLLGNFYFQETYGQKHSFRDNHKLSFSARPEDLKFGPKMSYLETKLKSDCYREPRLKYKDVFKSIADLGHLRPLPLFLYFLYSIFYIPLFLPSLDQLSLSRPLPTSSS